MKGARVRKELVRDARIFTVQGFEVTVERKSVRRLNLRLNGIDGTLKVSIPRRCSWSDAQSILDGLVFRNKEWITLQLAKIRRRLRFVTPEADALNSIWIWGELHPIEFLSSCSGRIRVEQMETGIRIHALPETSSQRVLTALRRWRHEQVRYWTLEFIAKWEPRLGVQHQELVIRDMKSLWGACRIHQKKIVINGLLFHRPRQYLEEVVLHELVHLLEPSHNSRFKEIMGAMMPNWKQVEREMNGC